MRPTIRKNAKLVILAYIIPFLCVAGALWSITSTREARRAVVSEVFAENRDALLLVCEDLEGVKRQFRLTIKEGKAENIKQLANFENNPEIRRILQRSIQNADTLLKRFGAKDCSTYPFIRRGEDPYP